MASNPSDRVSWHNLAAAEGDLGRVAEAEAAARRAIALGIAAPETRLVLGRALQGLHRLDDAERVLAVTCEALLAAGRIEEANAAAQALVAAQPLDQHALALQATAWRLRGDPRYAAVCDYANLVDVQRLDVPAGFANLGAFLAAVANELEGLHSFQAHPLQQSVRGGSQLHLQPAEIARPVINALFVSITAAVQRHLARLGRGADPLRARNTGRFGFSGAWSVRLRSGGHHADHVHPQGWISSACYIALPPGVGAEGNDHAGWLRLGKPAIPTLPPLEAEHYVRPEPGNLVLFPAYMWHGVEPFTSHAPRLSVAFDVVPA